MGYSLGAQVVKSMINRLGKLDVADIVHNATFLAGATYIKSEKLDYQTEVFSRIVNGKITNVFSRKDKVCGLFNVLVKQSSLARTAYLARDPQNASCELEGDKAYSFDNHDVTDIIKDHRKYSNNLDLILERVCYDS
jgi:hypothetical protein